MQEQGKASGDGDSRGSGQGGRKQDLPYYLGGAGGDEEGGGSGGVGEGTAQAYCSGGSIAVEEKGGDRTGREGEAGAGGDGRLGEDLTSHVLNYDILDLNGSPMEVRYRWRRTVLNYRLWCFNNTNLRYEFGDGNRRSCTLPDSRNFLAYVHYDGKWICAVIDGASGYLDGYITRSTGRTIKDLLIRESSEIGTEPQYIEHAKKLPWDGGYFDEAAYTRCGDGSLANSFLILYDHVDEQVPRRSTIEVISAGETFILHLPEAGRSDSLFIGSNIFRNFRAANMVGKEPIYNARKWKSSCATVYRAAAIKDTEFSSRTKDKRHTYAREGVATNSDVAEAKTALEDIRLMHRPNHKRGYFYLKDMPMHLSKDGPVDPIWAENELKNSHKKDLDDSSWGFLTEYFPPFPTTKDAR